MDNYTKKTFDEMTAVERHDHALNLEKRKIRVEREVRKALAEAISSVLLNRTEKSVNDGVDCIKDRLERYRKVCVEELDWTCVMNNLRFG